MALPITNFIIERILEYNPRFDTGGGTATSALMIDPLSIILQPLRDEIDEIKLDQSVKSVLESEDPDAFDEEVVDALASNVFLSRKEGSTSSGSVRVRFFSPQDLDIGSGLAAFSDSSGARFINPNPVSITASEMGLNVDGGYYYVDIQVESEEHGTLNNAKAGAIQTFENEPENVANVTNLYDFTGGNDRETNLELIDRIEVAVTVRALVTGRGIVTQLQDNFSTIDEIKPIGFGDAEMQRDIVHNAHIGGNVDVWVKTPQTVSKSYDVVSVISDMSRRSQETTSLIMEDPDPSTYSLRHGGIDRTNMNPIVGSSDGFMTFIENVDYKMDDLSGNISRVASGSIYHDANTAVSGIQSDSKTILDMSAPWGLVRPGMQIKITGPSSVEGTYSVKTVLASEIVIYGNFKLPSVGNVSWQIDDVVSARYEYNPISIDVIKSVRSSSRQDYTITDTPVLRITSIEVLDPTTLQPTGTFLDPTGGYGQGGFGIGSYGIGTDADFVYRISQANLRYSVNEDNYIDIVTSKLGLSLRVNYDTVTEVASYQDYVDNAQNRVETADLLVKHFIPVYVSASAGGITYYVKASNSSALSEEDMQLRIEKLINDTPIGTNLEISDIVSSLYDAGATRVDLGFSLSAQILHTDGDVQFIESGANGILEIPENLPADGTLVDTDKPLSKNIAHFIPDGILMTRVTT